jgi:hypothetical protein
MCKFLVWRFIARHSFLPYPVHLWRIDGSPGDCVADGIRRISGELLSIKNKNYKPVSRILFPMPIIIGTGAIIYLSRQLPAGINLPTLQCSRPGTRSGEQPSTIGLCGISACKVYPPVMLPLQAVSSYLTFSPLLPVSSRLRRDETGCGYFLWHYLFRIHLARSETKRTRLLTGALLCAVRTFLSPPKRKAITRLVAKAKLTHFRELP